MEIFTRWSLVIMAFILIILMVIFLAGKTKCMIALRLAAFVLGIGIVLVVIAIIYFSYFSGGMFVALGVALVTILYLIPTAYMLNLMLFVIVFNDITNLLKGILKICVATSLILFSLFLYSYLFEYEIFVWARSLPGYLAWAMRIISAIIYISWPLSALIIPFVLFAKALKNTDDTIKRKWLKIAFFCPIVGPILYLCRGKTRCYK